MRIQARTGGYRSEQGMQVRTGGYRMLLALYGAGAMGREFKYMADNSARWDGIVFIDDQGKNEELLGCRVMDYQAFSERYTPDQVRFVVAIGEPVFRLRAFDKMKRAGYQGAVLCDPSAYISPDAEVGEGTAICRGSYIGSLARIGRNVYISTGAAVGHDAVIGDHTRLGVYSFTGGHVRIGENVFIGAGAMLRDRIQVGNGSIVAIGAAVFDSVPEHVTMIGNPARAAGETDGRAVYQVQTQAAAAAPAAEAPAQGVLTRTQVAEKYWEVFESCFEGIDFNPVTFHFHDDGWDSVSHMKLAAELEKAFGIHFKGREIMRLNTFGSGLELVRKKLCN